MTADAVPGTVARVATPGKRDRLLHPNQQFVAVIQGQWVSSYRQRFTYLGTVETDADGRQWLHARRTSNSRLELVALDTVAVVTKSRW